MSAKYRIHYKQCEVFVKASMSLDTLTSSQVSSYDGAVLKIYLDHKFQMTTGGFELRIHCIRNSYLIH